MFTLKAALNDCVERKPHICATLIRRRSRFLRDMARCERLTGAKYFCVNSLDKYPEEDSARILSWLARRLGITL